MRRGRGSTWAEVAGSDGSSTTELGISSWGTYDAEACRADLFVDGTLDETFFRCDVDSTGPGVRLGAGHDPDGGGGPCKSYRGTVDDVVTWSEARSPFEVGQDRAEQASSGTVPPAGTPGLSTTHALDEALGLSVFDGSGNGRHGALAGPPNTPAWVAGF